MKTMLIRLLPLFVFTLDAQTLYSQARETLDIVSYAVPQGWKKETTNSGVAYTAADNTSGEWCMITIYKSLTSSGNLASDFDHEWNELVTKVYSNTVKPTPESMAQDGWTVQSGAANFTWQGRQSIILLNVVSGNGRVASVTISMNGRKYKTEAERFLDSIEMQAGNARSSTPTIPIITDDPAGKSYSGTGITKSTTNFSDGWVAQAEDGYVLVSKENIKLYIHYGTLSVLPVGADESSTTKANWDKFITPRYKVSNLWLNPDVGMMSTFNYYAEGAATELSTGRQVFIGFRTLIEGGVHFCVEAVAPNKDDYLRHFPNLNVFNDMRNSNRFAVTTSDVIGEWSSASGSTLQYYNVYTGQSAGIQFSQGGQEFIFRGNGEYNANVSGSMGNMGGSQAVFDNKYAGTFTVSDWELALKNYERFTCYFEAVRGGRILHIAKKNAPGVRYALVKVK